MLSFVKQIIVLTADAEPRQESSPPRSRVLAHCLGFPLRAEDASQTDYVTPCSETQKFLPAGRVLLVLLLHPIYRLQHSLLACVTAVRRLDPHLRPQSCCNGPNPHSLICLFRAESVIPAAVETLRTYKELLAPAAPSISILQRQGCCVGPVLFSHSSLLLHHSLYLPSVRERYPHPSRPLLYFPVPKIPSDICQEGHLTCIGVLCAVAVACRRCQHHDVARPSR